MDLYWADRMTLLTENNGWAIVWMNNRYYVKHLACGSYLRRTVSYGCLCQKEKPDMNTPAEHTIFQNRLPAQVDLLILQKYKLLTKD